MHFNPQNEQKETNGSDLTMNQSDCRVVIMLW